MGRKTHIYSRFTKEALRLLGRQIQLARKSRRMSEKELAERVGIARSTLQRIEQGDPTVNIGLGFEAAIVVGVQLFVPEPASLAPNIEQTNQMLTLMPKRIRSRSKGPKDDF